MKNLSIRLVSSQHNDLHKLISQLDAYLFSLYPLDEVFIVDFTSSDLTNFQFVVAYDGDVAVGCGGIKKLNQKEVELKRFFVIPTYRNQGIASLILKYLENLALLQQYSVIKLETGEPQFESIRFYQKSGFKSIARYGEYVDCESSVCMEKQL